MVGGLAARGLRKVWGVSRAPRAGDGWGGPLRACLGRALPPPLRGGGNVVVREKSGRCKSLLERTSPTPLVLLFPTSHIHNPILSPAISAHLHDTSRNPHLPLLSYCPPLSCYYCPPPAYKNLFPTFSRHYCPLPAHIIPLSTFVCYFCPIPAYMVLLPTSLLPLLPTSRTHNPFSHFSPAIFHFLPATPTSRIPGPFPTSLLLLLPTSLLQCPVSRSLLLLLPTSHHTILFPTFACSPL